MVETVEKPSDFLPNFLKNYPIRSRLIVALWFIGWEQNYVLSYWDQQFHYLRGSRTTKHELNTDFRRAEIANVIGKMK